MQCGIVRFFHFYLRLSECKEQQQDGDDKICTLNAKHCPSPLTAFGHQLRKHTFHISSSHTKSLTRGVGTTASDCSYPNFPPRCSPAGQAGWSKDAMDTVSKSAALNPKKGLPLSSFQLTVLVVPPGTLLLWFTLTTSCSRQWQQQQQKQAAVFK